MSDVYGVPVGGASSNVAIDQEQAPSPSSGFVSTRPSHEGFSGLSSRTSAQIDGSASTSGDIRANRRQTSLPASGASPAQERRQSLTIDGSAGTEQVIDVEVRRVATEFAAFLGPVPTESTDADAILESHSRRQSMMWHNVQTAFQVAAQQATQASGGTPSGIRELRDDEAFVDVSLHDDTAAPLSAATDQGAAGNAPGGDAEHSAFANWARNTLNVVGHELFAVAVTTALREAAGAGAQALLTYVDASDLAKTAMAGGLYSTAILANVIAMLYQEQQGIATTTSRLGNIAQIVAMSAAFAAAGATGTLKDQVPNLVKTGVYSAGRDAVNLLWPLGDNLPKGRVNPLALQAINSAIFYLPNQILVGSLQSFHGLSGAGLVDAMQSNSTARNSTDAVTLSNGFASLATYVTANFAGETVNQIVERVLKSQIGGSSLPDLRIDVSGPALPGWQKTLDTLAGEGMPRIATFYTTYGGAAAIDSTITPPNLGMTSALWMQSVVGGALIALLCISTLMSSMTKGRANFESGSGVEESPAGPPPEQQSQQAQDERTEQMEPQDIVLSDLSPHRAASQHT